jgi:hypothetical protein
MGKKGGNNKKGKDREEKDGEGNDREEKDGKGNGGKGKSEKGNGGNNPFGSWFGEVPPDQLPRVLGANSQTATEDEIREQQEGVAEDLDRRRHVKEGGQFHQEIWVNQSTTKKKNQRPTSTQKRARKRNPPPRLVPTMLGQSHLEDRTKRQKTGGEEDDNKEEASVKDDTSYDDEAAGNDDSDSDDGDLTGAPWNEDEEVIQQEGEALGGDTNQNEVAGGEDNEAVPFEVIIFGDILEEGLLKHAYVSMDMDSLVLMENDPKKLVEQLQPGFTLSVPTVLSSSKKALSSRLSVHAKDNEDNPHTLPRTKKGVRCVHLHNFHNVELGEILHKNAKFKLHLHWLDPPFIGDKNYLSRLQLSVIVEALNLARGDLVNNGAIRKNRYAMSHHYVYEMLGDSEVRQEHLYNTFATETASSFLGSFWTALERISKRHTSVLQEHPDDFR